ncbi:MAG: 4-(cytidine 5'-diphospho)-2-C-methyl-D-erythritol kinase [Peptococcaceae bacterium]|nr:4-(cytidine 5'-diphospho)-2-C-methyl-D-erythritol kinase [Peptococcaceae bacterium]
MRMKVKARAKINLSLDVLGKRGDGYHEILTVMQALELHDVLEVEPLPGEIRVESNGPEVPPGPDNIVYRAAGLIRTAYGCNGGARIYIHKNIPVAAGLAGGSTDAAAALRALNELWALHIEEGELFKLGEKLGADVPFCLLGKTALAGGKGEVLTPLPAFSGFGVVLVKPPFGVSTARIYSLYDTCPPGPGPDTRALVKALKKRDVTAVAGLMGNVLERVTSSLHPEILDIKKALLAAGAAGALMSGSGPAVFGLCAGREEARAVASRLNLPGCRIIATETA